MSISDPLGPAFFYRKMEEMRLLSEKMDRILFIFHETWHFNHNFFIMKVLSHISTLTWRVNNYICRHGKGVSRGTRALKAALEHTDVNNQYSVFSDAQ